MRTMSDWNYANPSMLELRFEAAVKDPLGSFREIFRFYGLRGPRLERALAIAGKLSFRHMAGRAPGAEDRRSHFRKGQPGDWKQHFSADHRALFKELYPGLLTHLGYERDENW
jgi:hypothetical protein